MKLEDTVIKMNIGVLVFGNAIFWIIVAAFEDKFLKSDFFCNNFFDSYYLKNIKDFEISKQMKTSIKINDDGFAEMLNDKAYLFKWGVTAPLILFLMFWPVIYICWVNNIMFVSYLFISMIILPVYTAVIMGIKYVFTDYDRLNENFPYNQSYYTFGLVNNILTYIALPAFIVGFYIKPSVGIFLSIVLLIIKLHAYIFIEVFDSYFNLNILETKNLNRIWIFEILFLLFLVALYFMKI